MSTSLQQPRIDVDEYLTTALSATPPELHPYFQAFQELHSRKLWHQLTVKLLEFFAHPLALNIRVDVFNRFVRDFEPRLNPLRLVEMGVTVSKDIDNPEQHVTFLTSLLGRVDAEASPDAHVLLLSTLAHSKLVFGDIEGSKKDIDAAWAVLDNLSGVESTVNAAYYSVAADYYKAKAEYAPYYRNSLLYLACVDLEKDMTAEERLGRAHDLSIAAFLGDEIYNFGELLMHPILDSLDGTPHDWLKKLLFTFNEGNIGKFEALAPLFPKEPILQENYPYLRQKICLMALIESVFKRNAYDRTMSFQTIAEETRLALEEVEHMIMKALSYRFAASSIAISTFISRVHFSPSPTGNCAFSFAYKASATGLTSPHLSTSPGPSIAMPKAASESPLKASSALPTSAFSFTAPFPSTSTATATAGSLQKQRRVSLALPSSPRQVPAWTFRDDTGIERRGKMRKLSTTDAPVASSTEKKVRKKWTMEETQMLVEGCNRHGVGNWKSILNDPSLKFDHRSPVDLKDRFRTYFPDAYKQHYPNAKTHLSSKIRSALPDGSSIFEKTRSKKRRPFTEEEDRALKAGYDKHGTVWAAIVKDPIFQEQNRRSTDLRDRFRNAFPELYKAAGYKPRATAKKTKAGATAVATPQMPMRAATTSS
ncbi:hypothetical protein EWM64_g6637 [Hericium alpestre]|uniref:Myb-like domain-containing protein n=1 Tax=Hericium alpestre TaxID=135208 RepID=A0A4Y9ZTJ6_9AGAM|nr:hypothetical protein EWM64_g6637 [Hericium alpestre]